MKEKKAMLVINPVAGTRSKKGLADMVESRLGEHGISVTSVETAGSGDAGAFATQAAVEGYDMVISAGGDGTVNEIAGALSHTQTALGILPLGSGNGLARSLWIPQDVGEALKIITDGHILTSDRGIAGDNPFYCTFGIGFDAAVSEKFAQNKRRGRMTYIKNVIQEFISYQSQPYAISIGGQVLTENAFLIAVCNAPQYGNNAYIAPQAKLDDGLLDITVIHSGSPFTTMLVGVDLLAGSLDKNTHIDTFRVSSATITRLKEGPVHVDGDPLTMGKNVEVRCEPGALKIFAPSSPAEFKPIVSPLRSMLSDIRYDVLAKFRR
ncbi:MAG: diacylglycerol kinase family lipid kinase [Muribaculaceae bacterium]|nr:diacylglycerol kinase family lipid kinase [Muribaculaceae bacterium]MDE7108525.1 diacylglycerol kinase family lipid kinase [Muribaculaceae bacterium]